MNPQLGSELLSLTGAAHRGVHPHGTQVEGSGVSTGSGRGIVAGAGPVRIGEAQLLPLPFQLQMILLSLGDVL